MEEELLSCVGSPVKLGSLLASKRVLEITKFIDKLLTDDESELTVNLLEAVTCGVFKHEGLLEICEALIERMWSGCIADAYRTSLSFFLNNAVGCLEDWKLERFCVLMISKLSIDCGEMSWFVHSFSLLSIFDALWKSLSRLEGSNVVLTPLIESMCKTQWSNANAVGLLESMKSYSFTVDSKLLVFNKVLSDLHRFEYQMIPSITKSVLLSSCLKTLAIIIDYLRLYFESGTSGKSNVPTTIREAVLLQLFDLCNESAQFSQNLLVSLKTFSRDWLLSDFVCSLLLTILPIQSLEQRVLNLLNSAILGAFTDTQLLSGSSFLRQLCVSPEDPANRILILAQRCSAGNHTVDGLVLLGFGLLRSTTSFGSSASATHVSNRSSRMTTCAKIRDNFVSPFSSHHRMSQRVLRLAVDTLIHLFKHCASSRAVIMNIVVNMLWSEPSKPIAVKLVDFLSCLVALCPLEIATCTSRLDPIIDCIGLVPLELSVGLVHALLPLIRAGSHLTDVWSMSQRPTENPLIRFRARLFSTLCKAATSPRVQSRRVAVACFLLLLKHLKVSVASFRSASQQSSSDSLSQSTQLGFTQVTQNNPMFLYSQLQSTQIAQQITALPCDSVQNEALCTEIISVLHRVIFSAFFRSRAGCLLEDVENKVKSDVYWGLCEVVTRNKGMYEPVLNLYLRLLLSSLSPGFLRDLKRCNINDSSLPPSTGVTSSQTSRVPIGPPVSLDQLVMANPETGGELYCCEHPDILAWCLQLLITQSAFSRAWRQFRLARSRSSEAESESSQPTAGFSQFTQSTLSGTVECGRSVSQSLFTKAVRVLLALSDSLRVTPLDDFGLNGATDFASSATGKVNRRRAELLLGLYDACLEFELKDPLELMSSCNVDPSQANDQNSGDHGWTRVRYLFGRRLALFNLLMGRTGATAQGSLLLPSFSHSSQSRVGLWIVGLISATQSELDRVFHAVRASDTAKSLALHLLQTITCRLKQFMRCPGGSVPCAYRDVLIQTITPILKHVLRFYHHLIHSEPDSLGPVNGQPAAAENPTSLPVRTVNEEEEEEPAKSRSNLIASVSSASVGLLDVALTLALDYLGTDRLHKLAIQIYSVAINPTYPKVSDAADEDPDDDTADVAPAHALSTLIKLIKGWITKLLNPIHSAVSSSTQKASSHHANSHIKDLVTLLPLLVRLCQARAQIGSIETPCFPRPIHGPYTGLDRVLAWLIRLMRTSHAAGKSRADSNPLPVAVRVKLIGQAIWLAHLVGPVANDYAQRLNNSDELLHLDYLLTTIATDVRGALGDCSSPHDAFFNPTQSECEIIFPIINRSSALALLPPLFSTVRQVLTELEWLLSRLTSDLETRISVRTPSHNSPCANGLEGNNREEALCSRLISLGEMFAQFLFTAIPVPSAHGDNLLELSARVFNVLTQLVKYYLRIVRTRTGRFPVLFERVVRVFGKDVSPRAYHFISYIQHSESEKVKMLQDKQSAKNVSQKDVMKKTAHGSSVSHTMVSRSLKDSRVIPQLIYAIEQFERFLMQLSKLSKVNLMRNVKLAVSRDFRINPATVVAQLEHSAALDTSTGSDDEPLGDVTDSPHQEGRELTGLSRTTMPENAYGCLPSGSDGSHSVVDLQLPNGSQSLSLTNSERSIGSSTTRTSVQKRPSSTAGLEEDHSLSGPSKRNVRIT